MEKNNFTYDTIMKKIAPILEAIKLNKWKCKFCQ